MVVPDLWTGTEPRSGLRNARGRHEQGSGAGGARCVLENHVRWYTEIFTFL